MSAKVFFRINRVTVIVPAFFRCIVDDQDALFFEVQLSHFVEALHIIVMRKRIVIAELIELVVVGPVGAAGSSPHKFKIIIFGKDFLYNQVDVIIRSR